MRELNMKDAKPLLGGLRELEKVADKLANREQSGTAAQAWSDVRNSIREARANLVTDLWLDRAYWRRQSIDVEED